MSGKIEYSGTTRIQRLTTRKETVEEEKELACYVNLCLSDVPVETIDGLDPMLGEFLFNSDGDVRNPLIGPITILARMQGYALDIAGIKNLPCSLNKITLWPSDGERFSIQLVASFKPKAEDFFVLAKRLTEDVPVRLYQVNGALF